jgi:hypothetical protein
LDNAHSVRDKGGAGRQKAKGAGSMAPPENRRYAATLLADF